MKKLLAALVGALVIGGAAFAENHTCGIDIGWAFTFGKTSADTMIEGEKFEFGLVEIGLPALLPNKISTYDCFLLNNHLGIYASAGYNLNFDISTVDDAAYDAYIGLAGEFMVGPAFGVDIGRTRFQTGVAFHMMGATLWGLGDDYEDDEIDNKLKYSAFGLALTPQFRFAASPYLGLGINFGK